MTSLPDITFIIPFMNDGQERVESMDHCISFLEHHFDTNIFIAETGPVSEIDFNEVPGHFFKVDDGIFYRTYIMNESVKMIKTPYFVVHDVDVFLNPAQYVKAYEMVKSGIPLVYPYDGTFQNISRRYLADGTIEYLEVMNPESVGGCYMFNKKSFIEAGMYNETLVSYAFDDSEICARYSILGYEIRRVTGILLHINHYRGLNSSATHPYYRGNEIEFEKVRAMSKEQLTEYISTWKWLK